MNDQQFVALVVGVAAFIVGMKYGMQRAQKQAAATQATAAEANPMAWLTDRTWAV
jgi:hypothetical protein